MRIRIKDLQPETEYAIQLRGNDGEAVSEWSRRFVITTVGDNTDPSVPDNVVWAPHGTSFLATWDAVTLNSDGSPMRDFDHYEIEISNAGDTVTYKRTDERFDFTFEMNRAAFGQPKASVGFRVRAKDIHDNPAVGGWSSLITATNAAPSTPTGFAASGTVNGIQLEWDQNTEPDVEGYYVYVSSSPVFTPGPGNRVAVVKSTSYTYPSLDFTSKYFKLSAFDVFGTESGYATANGNAFDPTSTDATAPNNPTNFVATPGYNATTSQAYFALTWTASTSTDVGEYLVRYSTDASNWSQVSFPGDSTTGTVDDVVPNTDYYLAIKAKDFSGNANATWLNATVYPVHSLQDTVAPSKPSDPIVVSDTMQIQIKCPLTKDSDGTALEADLDHFDAHASTTSGFTPDDSTFLGTIEAAVVAIGVFPIPAEHASATTQTWYVKVKAVDHSGNKSVSSDQTVATPGLVGTLNIFEIDAAKLKANTAIINDLSVWSTLTLGDATHTGVVRSYDYGTSGGVTGFSMDKTNGLIVKTGAIEAPALRIQNSQNLMLPQYADFEYVPTVYTGGGITTVSATAAIATVNAKFNAQALQLSWGAIGVDPTGYLGTSTTNYNVIVDGSATYIISGYAKTATAGTNGRLRVKWSDGTTSTINSLTLTSTYQRLNGTATAPSGATAALVFVDSTTHTAADMTWDGIQFERKQSGETAPSQWKPPGLTSVDGGVIRTGSIQSSALAVNPDTGATIAGLPAWSINMTGGAQFGDMRVRGTTVIGISGETTPSTIQSYNFVTGTSGWQIRSDGLAEFGSVDARGLLQGSLRTSDPGAQRILITDDPTDGGTVYFYTGHEGGSDWHRGWMRFDDVNPYGFINFRAPGNDTFNRDVTIDNYGGVNTDVAGGFFIGSNNSLVQFGMSITDGQMARWTRSGGVAPLAVEFRMARMDFNPAESGGPTQQGLSIDSQGTGVNSYGRIYASSGDVGLTFLKTDALRVSNPAGGGFRPIQASAFPVNSDIAVKKDLQIVDGEAAIEQLAGLPVYDYMRTDINDRQRGFIAQDVDRAVPIAIPSGSEEGLMMVDPYSLLGTAVAAIQSLAKKVDELQDRLDAAGR